MSSLLHSTLRLSITKTITRPAAFTTWSAPTATSTLHVRAYASKAKHRQKGGGRGGGGGGRNNNNSTLPDADAESESSSSSSSQTGCGASGGSSKKRAPITTASLTPGSQQTLTDPVAREEYTRADAKMAASLEWFRREVAQLEARASGRVTPRLLAPVRVSPSVAPSASGAGAGSGRGAQKARLEEVATVGVRDGSTLIVTVFDPQNLKHVEDALYEAKIHGVIPQRVDERTLRIPIPKPTVEARLAAYSTASKQAEEARVQIRRQHQASVKKGKYHRHSIAHDEFQKLQDRHIADVDTILAQIKKSSGAR